MSGFVKNLLEAGRLWSISHIEVVGSSWLLLQSIFIFIAIRQKLVVAVLGVPKLLAWEWGVRLPQLVRELTDILKVFLSILVFLGPLLHIVDGFAFLKPL